MLNLIKPFLPVFKIKLSVEMQTFLGMNGTMHIVGPTDIDFDGDPEFSISVDAPGTAFDTKEPLVVEIPVHVLTSSLADVVSFAMTAVKKGKP